MFLLDEERKVVSTLTCHDNFTFKGTFTAINVQSLLTLAIQQGPQNEYKDLLVFTVD